MVYLGGKSKIAKELLGVMLLNREVGQWYVEPFCGGCNVIDKVGGKRLASDNNFYLIAMWKDLLAGRKFPERINKDMYDRAKADYENGENYYYDDALIGWIGYIAGYKGAFFKGFENVGAGRDFISERVENVKNQIPLLRGVEFRYSDYRELEIPNRSLIYCDPPYADTLGYLKEFDTEEFWDWVRMKTDEGHKVFVSEYVAPSDFVAVWEKSVNRTFAIKKKERRIERLFVHENLVDRLIKQKKLF